LAFISGLDGTIQTALDINGAGPGHHVADAVRKNGVGKDRRRARSVTDALSSLLCRLAQHLEQSKIRCRRLADVSPGSS
jgi:hypothetical protein